MFSPFSSDSPKQISKILIIYCGGTIGMEINLTNGCYEPSKGFLVNYLSENSIFNKSSMSSPLNCPILPSINGPVLKMSPSKWGMTIYYQIKEYDPLKDSSNMDMDDWIGIALDIEKNYHHYDSFIILHGTDTISYTASALSFLFQNLGKSIIITGSQIPFCEVRNDAYSNLIGSIMIASRYVIPEVCVLFNNKLFRGNRVIKHNSENFHAFDSPNMSPLATLGVDITVNWDLINYPNAMECMKVWKRMSPDVSSLRIFPGMTTSSLKATFSPNIKGVVLETFGSGNFPNIKKDLLAVINEAVLSGVIVLNVTQCIEGMVDVSYSTGHSLQEIGVISGSDMTTECAIVKLQYVLSLPDVSLEEMKAQLQRSLRGELRSKKIHYPNPSFDKLLKKVDDKSFDSLSFMHVNLLHASICKGSLAEVENLMMENINVDVRDWSGNTPLYNAISFSHINIVEYLLSSGANIHIRNFHGKSIVLSLLPRFNF